MAGETWEAAKNEALKISGEVADGFDVKRVFDSAKSKMKKSEDAIDSAKKFFGKDVTGEKLDAKGAEALHLIKQE
jgi:hypothetical protein